jgi:GTP-binding protein Era
MTRKCGHVAVIGAPNAGKSTLVNALVGQKVAIVSPKAQTTRVRLMGVAIEGETQIILVDTPGIFAPQRRLDRAMVAAAWDGAQDADLVLLVVDGRAGAGPKVEKILQGLAGRPERKWLFLNKVDIAAKDKLLSLTEKLTGACEFEQIFFVSAATGDGLAEFKTALSAAMPDGEWHFPEDQVSDATDRIMAAEITREQLYLQLHEELPYASTVETEKYVERDDGSLEIYQQILVERPTQRAIILGKGGTRIKAIGEAARAELTQLMGVRVHLYLHVKVNSKWDEDRSVYRDMGLDWVE